MHISKRVKNISEALSIHINEIVYELKRKDVDLITLSLGEAFFDIPFYNFNELDAEKCNHYSDSQGLPSLRAKIAKYYNDHYNAQVDPDKELIISAGSKALIFMVMQCVVDEGEEVLIQEPAWLSYQEQARLVGGSAVFLPFDCPVSSFHQHFTSKTRLVIINNPNNPSGRLYTAQELRDLYEQCQSHGIYLLVDEAYSDFVVESSSSFHSLAEIAPDKKGVIIVNSLSKNMGISGWRVGYAITHPESLKHLQKVNQHIITCAPTILLYYLDQNFEKIIKETLPQVKQVVKKRQIVEEVMREEGLPFLEGVGTFYIFASIGDYPGSSLDLAYELIFEEGVAVVPGSAYGESTSRYIRISIGTESEENIRAAIVSIKRTINKKSVNRDKILSEMNKINKDLFLPAGG